MITRDEVLMGRDKEYPLTPGLEFNLSRLLSLLAPLRIGWGKPMVITSGYRPGRYNKAAGGATLSPHLTCEAVDIQDKDGSLAAWLTPDRLGRYGLYMENPTRTPGWVHLDTRIRANRIFNP